MRKSVSLKKCSSIPTSPNSNPTKINQLKRLTKKTSQSTVNSFKSLKITKSSPASKTEKPEKIHSKKPATPKNPENKDNNKTPSKSTKLPPVKNNDDDPFQLQIPKKETQAHWQNRLKHKYPFPEVVVCQLDEKLQSKILEIERMERRTYNNEVEAGNERRKKMKELERKAKEMRIKDIQMREILKVRLSSEEIAKTLPRNNIRNIRRTSVSTPNTPRMWVPEKTSNNTLPNTPRTPRTTISRSVTPRTPTPRITTITNLPSIKNMN